MLQIIFFIYNFSRFLLFEEKAYLDNEAIIAAEQGLGYDKPFYKPEKYILKFSELKKLF